MKNINIFTAIFLLGLILVGCKDSITERYLSLEPVYMNYSDFRASVKVTSQKDLVKPGKIYTIGKYLFINESLQGVHVYDNSDPALPKYVCFISIQGNTDIAVKNNILYGDSYIDLVAIDITDPSKAKEVARVKQVFPYSLPPFSQTENPVGAIDISRGVVVGWELKHVQKETIIWDQPIIPINFGKKYADDFLSLSSATDSYASSSGEGAGGAMARFGFKGNYLVVVGTYSTYYNFDLSDRSNLKLVNSQTLKGSGIETMFLSGNYMFLGAQSGMLIYDLSDPLKPVYLSTFWHATGCDPVVVQGNRAYVTLRSGVICANRSINELSVLDITNVNAPVLLRSYVMDNPYGLGISGDILFVCDGTSGLKIFDASDPLLIAEHQLARFPGIQAYDVIPLGKSLLMIGSDGFYQYDNSDVKNIRQISVISVKK